jgi:transcriptional regulator with XRE-family HTH domain
LFIVYVIKSIKNIGLQKSSGVVHNSSQGEKMTPFGKLLSQIMFDAGTRQKDLVEVTGLSATHISHMLSGQKGPPCSEKVEKIIAYLGLDDIKAAKLRIAAANSSRTLSIPEDAKPEEFLVAHELCARLGRMLPGQIVAIREIIRLGNTAG